MDSSLLTYITTSYGWLKSIFSEISLATLAGIRATNRNVNRPCSFLNSGNRRWELHHENRLVALRTKIKVRRPNSFILKGKSRVWCEVDGFWNVFWALILDLETETLPESRSFDAASVRMGLEGWCHWNYGFFSPGRVEIPQNFGHTISENILHKTCGFSIGRAWSCE